VGEKVSEHLNHGQIFAVFGSTPSIMDPLEGSIPKISLTGDQLQSSQNQHAVKVIGQRPVVHLVPYSGPPNAGLVKYLKSFEQLTKHSNWTDEEKVNYRVSHGNITDLKPL